MPQAKRIVFPSRDQSEVTLKPEFEESPGPIGANGPEVHASSPPPPVIPRAKAIAFPTRRRGPDGLDEFVAETGAAPQRDRVSESDFGTPEPSVSLRDQGAVDELSDPSRPMVAYGLRDRVLGTARLVAIAGGTALLSYFVVRGLVPSTLSEPHRGPEVASSAAPVRATATVATPSVAAAPVAVAKPKPAAASGLPDAKIEDLPTPPGFALDPSRGLLEVVTPNREAIHVDGSWMGRGPLRRIPIAGGEHQVEIKTEGDSRTFDVTVVVGRRVRVTLGGG